MAEVGTATVEIVPDMSEFQGDLETSTGRRRNAALEFLLAVAGFVLLLCAPAIVWAVYGWAF